MDNPELEKKVSLLQTKLKGLIQHCEQIEDQNHKLMREKRELNYGDVDANVWFWMEGEENHLESLTCPVVIDAEVLRQLINNKE